MAKLALGIVVGGLIGYALFGWPRTGVVGWYVSGGSGTDESR